jgi:hypothetical protein
VSVGYCRRLLEAAEAVFGRTKEAGGSHGECFGIACGYGYKVYSVDRNIKSYPANGDLYEVLT